jgi:uncharacterized protein YndB with AHSA1/START domain
MQSVTVETNVQSGVEKVWQYWNEPEHIKNWYFASDDWHAPEAANDLRVGGSFTIKMAAKDGSFGFDFEGKYLAVELNKYICYTLADERKVEIQFIATANATQIIETFDVENENPIEMQKDGWQMILNNFKRYVESLNKI